MGGSVCGAGFCLEIFMARQYNPEVGSGSVLLLLLWEQYKTAAM